MTDRGTIEKIYSQYKAKIDAVTEATNNNYKQAAEIVSYFYGGSVERWRKVLKNKKGTAMPKAVKDFLKLKKSK